MKSHRATRREGVATVELAIVLPVLVSLTFGVIEVTNLIYLKQSLEICAYEGARIALVPGTTPGNVEATCQSLLAARGVQGATITITPANFQSRPYGTDIKVSITARLADNLISPPFILSDRTVTGTVVMMKEQ